MIALNLGGESLGGNLMSHETVDSKLSKQRLSELLAELSQELHSAGDVDEKTRALLTQLHDDIDRLTGETHSSTTEKAKYLESQFAANHPIAERIAREFADVLAKMGI
jgi:hypothetical protein